MISKLKATAILLVALIIGNIGMGFIIDVIPSVGNTWMDWAVTAFINAFIILTVWTWMKRRFGKA